MGNFYAILRLMGKRKVVIIIIAVIVCFIVYKLFISFVGINSYKTSSLTNRQLAVSENSVSDVVQNKMPALGGAVAPYPENPPTVPGQVDKRLVIRDGNLSLVVKDLNEVKNKIITFVESNQGYLVSSEIYGVETNKSASVVIRIPEAKFSETLTYIRSLGVKVTSESVSGQDVTEEYVDLTARLKSLEASRNRFKEILQNASTVDQILQVQREIDRVQMEIEQTTGRMEYLSKSAAMSKISVNLALDEESLPYVPPTEKWKPAFVFKQAVRSLLLLLKDLSYFVIWIAVFAIVWVPLIFLFKFLKKKFWNKPLQQ